MGNPDLQPEKTVALEVGYEKEIAENLLFSITGFNKDITNLIDVQFFQIPLEDTGIYSSGVYTRFVNLAYGTANGLELLFKKQQGRIGGLLSDPTAYDVGRRVSLGLIW